jgi:WD40 repeat protein/tRNA A-37 threonylcarbamoyl transferase component Bud32
LAAAIGRRIQKACNTGLVQRRRAIVPNLDWLQQLNALCDDFELSWRSGIAPRVEDVLARAAPENRRELLLELVALELSYRRGRGEKPDQSEYIARFPDEACVVEQAFLADRGDRSAARTNGRPADTPEMSHDTSHRAGQTERHPKCSTLPLNSRIGNFELREEIGRGGMGIVYKARQLNLPRDVALKMILSGEFADRKEIERFRTEAEAVAGLRHPNIVPLHEVGEEGGRHFLAMAYIEGRDLHEVLRDGPLPPREGARLIQRIAEAVHYAHTQGIIHRDLKPGNILLDSAGEPHVTDFGLARRADADGRLTETGQILGTVGFMSPEQVRDRRDGVGPATDIYTLGALLYKCLTGRPPFQAADPIDALLQSVVDPPISPRILSPGIPRDLETVCLKCLEKEPARRYASAQELADDLGRHLRGEPIRARPIGRINRSWRWCRRRRALAALLAGAAAGVVLVATLLVVHNRDLAQLNDRLITKADEARRNQEAAERQERLATDLRQDAERNEGLARDSLYASDINRAASAWRNADPRSLAEILARHIPAGGEPDRRGFEWWYLHGKTGQTHRNVLEAEVPIQTICYSPDEHILAAAAKSGIVWLLEPESGKVLREIHTEQGEVNAIAFSPDGREFATAGDDGTVRIWNLETGAERQKIGVFSGPVLQLRYTGDGGQILCCGRNPVIRVFDARTGAPGRSFEGHTGEVRDIVLSNDGKTLGSLGSDEMARLWDLETGKNIHTFHTEPGAESLALTDNGRFLITGSANGILQSWRIAERTEVSRVQQWDGLRAVAIRPGRQSLATADNGGSIRMTDFVQNDTGYVDNNERVAWLAHRGRVNAIVWSKDGARLISCGEDGKVVSWEFDGAPETGSRQFRIDGLHKIGPPRFRVDAGFRMSLIPRSDRLIIGCYMPFGMTVWDWKTGDFLVTFERLETQDVCAAPDGQVFAAVRRRNELLIYPVLKNRTLVDMPKEIARRQADWPIDRVAFAPDSGSLAVAYHPSDGAKRGAIALVRAADLTTLEEVPVADTRRLVFAPRGGQLAIATGSTLMLWDLAAKHPVWSVPEAEIDALEISPDGELVATAGPDRDITVRSVADGAIRFQLPGHLAAICSLAFSPDGRTLASASVHGAIKLWHVATGQELFELHRAGVDCKEIRFSDDGRHLLSLMTPGGTTWSHVLVFDASDREQMPPR